MARLKKVLHVDDEDDIRLIAKMAMNDLGDLDILQCSSGEQALVEAGGFAPDLFLLDYMMPDMDGETTLRALRQIPGLEAVPVIFMTARVQNDFLQTLIANGALDVFPKPFDPIKLCAQLHYVWDKHTSK